MSKKVIDKKSAEDYTWGDDCDSWVLADTKGLSVKQESMPPKTKETLHFHFHAQQFFFVLKGCATFYVEDAKMIVEEQQGLLILPGAKHFIANESDQQLDFLVISQPPTTKDRTNLE